MDFYRAKQILTKKGVLISNRDLGYGFNKIRSHQHKFESIPHFLSKCIIGKLILKQGDAVITEHEYPDGKQIDVLQIKRNGDLIGYQIETGNYEEKEFSNTDVITIDLRKAPKEVHQAFKILEKYFRRFIV